MTSIPLPKSFDFLRTEELKSFHSKLKELLDRLDSINVRISYFRDGYLVGGCLRDLFINTLFEVRGSKLIKIKELDIVLSGEIYKRVKAFADNIGGNLFAVDEERVVWRVITAIEGETWRFDFSSMRGKKILHDLKLRDFSINALAIGIDDFLKKRQRCRVIDPSNGIKDIKEKRIRVIREDTFLSDPLRMLRAIRLSSQRGFSIEPETLRLIKRDAYHIQEVSSERIRDEIFKILSLPKAHKYVSILYRLDLLSFVFPELISMKRLVKAPYNYDLWKHSINTVRYLEKISGDLKRYLPDYTEPISQYLSKKIESEIDRKTLLKLCALFHDIGKPETVTIEPARQGGDDRLRFIGHQKLGGKIGLSVAKRLRLSVKAQTIVEQIILHHLRPLLLASQKKVTLRAIHRFFRETEEESQGILLLALADAKAKAEPEIKTSVEDIINLIKRMLDYYYGRYKEIKVEPLVKGRDLIEIFGLEPGPIFKKIFDEIEIKRAEGRIHNRDEALAWIREYLSNA